jgi:hypothetical protein
VVLEKSGTPVASPLCHHARVKQASRADFHS